MDGLEARERRTVPTDKLIGHEYLGGLRTRAALGSMRAKLKRNSRKTALLFLREGDRRRARTSIVEGRLAVEGSIRLEKSIERAKKAQEIAQRDT